MSSSRIFFLLVTLIIVNFRVVAETTIDRDIAKLCARAIHPVEKSLNLPKNILRAISLKETGRWHHKLKESMPWPWTVTSGGEGVYYNSKREALNAVRELQYKGITNIDVGCMQINLHYHPHAFKNLKDAFNPQLNAGYAGDFLSQLFEDHGSWQQAIEHYHSNNKKRGKRYRLAVEKLQRIDSVFFRSDVKSNGQNIWLAKQKILKHDLYEEKGTPKNRVQGSKQHRIKENQRLQQAFSKRKEKVLEKWKKMMNQRRQKLSPQKPTHQS